MTIRDRKTEFSRTEKITAIDKNLDKYSQNRSEKVKLLQTLLNLYTDDLEVS